jgi:hypothetical protein
MKVLIVILNVAIWKIVSDSVNISYDLIKQAKNNNFCKLKSIILLLFDPENANSFGELPLSI